MGETVRDYKDLLVWQRAMELAEEVYRLSRKLPREESFALGDQLRRAAVSVPSNIAEGSGRDTRKEYAHFLSIAIGSIRELETQLLIAVRVGHLSTADCRTAFGLLSETSRLLHAIRSKLVPRTASPTSQPQTCNL